MTGNYPNFVVQNVTFSDLIIVLDNGGATGLTKQWVFGSRVSENTTIVTFAGRLHSRHQLYSKDSMMVIMLEKALPDLLKTVF